MVASVIGVVLIVLILWDAFETIVLPRRVARRLRITGIVFHSGKVRGDQKLGSLPGHGPEWSVEEVVIAPPEAKDRW